MLAITIISLLSIASALFCDGPCPDVKVVEHFNLAGIKPGPWYQVARYPNDIEKKGDCVSLNYKDENGNRMMLIHEIVDGVLEEFPTVIKYDKDAGDSGKLMLYSSNFTESTSTQLFPLYVLDIDYDSYYIIYSCTYNEASNKRNEYFWLTSLTNKLQANAKIAIDKYLEGAKFIDQSKLSWDHFDLDHCKQTKA